jgi:flagellar motor switch protein FliN/FliY
MTTQEALVLLATSTAQAAADALRVFAPDDVATAPVSVVVPGTEPFQGAAVPAVVAGINYEGGVGGNVFAMPLIAARKLAAAMMGEAPPEDESDELTELELSAVGEAMNQMMAAAAASTSNTLDLEVDIDPPQVRIANEQRDLNLGFQGATRTTVTNVSLFGDRCILAQLVPTAFTMRLTQGRRAATKTVPTDEESAQEELTAAIRRVPLRVWAELGRAELPSHTVAALGDGAIVDLDRAAEDPVDLYVNGSRFATGRLVVDGEDWAVRIEEIFQNPEIPTTTPGGAH